METEYTPDANPSAFEAIPSDEKVRPAEKLRLRYLTGQDEDPNAPRDPSHFYGRGLPTRGAGRSQT